MISLNTNVSDLILQRTLLESTMGLNEAINRMSTGLKVNHAKDNAAGYSIIENLNTKISSMLQVQQNTADGISLLSTAQSVLEEIVSKYERLRELSIQASNGTNSGQSLEAIQAEADAIQLEIERLKESTTHDGNKLFGSLTPENNNAATFGISRLAQSARTNTTNVTDIISLYSITPTSVTSSNVEEGSTARLLSSPSSTFYSPSNNGVSLMSLGEGVSLASEVIDGGTVGAVTLAKNETATINIDGVLYEVTNTSTQSDFSWSKAGDTITFTGRYYTIRGESGKSHNVVLDGYQQSFHGAELSDNVVLNSESSKAYTYAGEDIVTIRKTRIIVETGDDNDTVYYEGGSNSNIYLGNGNDHFIMNQSADFTNIYGESGSDIFDVNNCRGSNVKYYGGDGDDVFNVTKISESSIIDGGNDSGTAAGAEDKDIVNQLGTSSYSTVNVKDANSFLETISANATRTISINTGLNGIVDYEITNTNSTDLNLLYQVNSTTGQITFNATDATSDVIIRGDVNKFHNVIVNKKIVFYGGNYTDNIVVNSFSTVYGLGGDDVITLQGQNSYAYGGDGADTLNVKGSWQTVYGESGNDTINCTSKENTFIDSGIGEDKISVSGKYHTIYNSGGSDTILSDTGTQTQFYGFGSEYDTLDNCKKISGNSTGTITIGTKTYTVENKSSTEAVVFWALDNATGEIKISGTETVGIAQNNLVITANSGQEDNLVIYGRATYKLGDKDDTSVSYAKSMIYGESGNDTHTEYYRSSYLGGNDNDTITLDTPSAGTMQSQAGNDTFIVKDGSAVSNLIGESGDDSYYIGNTITPGIITDTSGNNYYEIESAGTQITSGAGNDSFYINADNVTVNAGGGNDYFVVTSSNNKLNGQTGTNYYVDTVKDGTTTYENVNDDPNSGIVMFNSSDEEKEVEIGGKTYIFTNTGATSTSNTNSIQYTYNVQTQTLTLIGSGVTVNAIQSSNIIVKGSNNIIEGSNYSDTIRVAEGNENIINGNGGSDNIVLDSSDNEINGGGGNDTITLNESTSKIVNAGAGSDTLIINADNITNIDMGSGDDKITGSGSNNTIDLKTGTNSITLSGDNNTITDNGGKNTVNISGKNTDITLGGGSNKVTIQGQENTLTTGNGDNTVIIYGTQNTITTGSGNDKLNIEGDLNTVTTTSGNNTVQINGNENEFQGGSSSDTIEVTGSSNIVLGGDGNDNFRVTGSLNTIDGEGGSNNTLIDSGYNTTYTNVKKLNYIPYDVNVKVDIGGGEGKYITTSIGFNTAFIELDFTTREGALNNITQIDEMLSTLHEQLTNIGSMINRLEYVLDEQNIRLENMLSTRSTMRDADIAVESSKMIKQQILQQASTTLMASSRNLRYENVLGLLRGL